MPIRILGISAYYHDSAAALLVDGEVVAAAQEERFTRKKHDPGFPAEAVRYCLDEAGIQLKDIDHVVFYDKPLVKFERLLETYLAYAPMGFTSFCSAMPVWLKDKLFLKSRLKDELCQLSGLKQKDLPSLLFTEHHQSHAASAFFPSPYQKAAVLCLDGVGEWATTSVWVGDGNKLESQWEIDFPHSLGLLYSAFTYYCGFKVNSGEYKLMGLAPYGEPKYVDLIRDNLIDIKEDGTYRLNMAYFNYATGLTMTNRRFAKLFGEPARKAESQLTQKHMDLARSIQAVTEEIVLKLARSIKKEFGVDYLCLAGGVALNCVANGKLLSEKIFKEIWIQPAAGDAGGALGAAYAAWHQYLDKPRAADNVTDQSRGSYLGIRYDNSQIKQYLDGINAPYRELSDAELMPELAGILASENVVGWFQGRMEFGPRALGGRSIIGDPRSRNMQSVMNLKIKYRESFRPFAPAVKADKVADWFQVDTGTRSPYMLLVAGVNDEHRIPMTAEQEALFGIEKLNVPRSTVPAITHVDYSARLQTVHPETNPRFYALLDEFEKATGCPVLINTSFNVRGEPIVCSPEDAYRCFMRTEMDYLVLENILLKKSDQPAWAKDEAWKTEFELD
ncbi:carbamoyltransferase family protein [Methylogaea oryzae]|uniref:Carbamoyltransferase n=2 Tax=Methylogaea oryzae TaxID=1295382 RepID=A0A8D4VLQ5_9GAMM|nr:carbamoyltransferase [Methylogaea oryzae]BBL69847.1 carbamoyltransferase [Methylogaea oryzae]